MKTLKNILHALLPFAAFLAFAQPSLSLPFVLGDDDDKEEEGDSDEDKTNWFAITNADVYTGTGAVLRNATILSKDGVIDEIGYGIFVPEETEILDAMGMRVYPGLVALNATARISSGLFTSTGDFEEENLDEHNHGAPEDPRDSHYGLDDVGADSADSYRSHLEEGDTHGDGGDHVGDDHADPDGPAQAFELSSAIEDSFDPFSQYLVLALATGITTAEQSNSAIKLKRGEIKDVLLAENHLSTFSWGTTNPASTRGTREKFRVAAEHKRAFEKWDTHSEKEKKELKEPKKPKGFDAAAYKVLTGESLARFNLNDREDLASVAKLAQQYHFRPVISGCREGWTVARELGRAGAYAIITPRDRAAKNESLVRAGGTSIENAAILHEHGVQVAIRPQDTSFNLGGITGRDLMHLPVEAAFGVRGGLSEEAALAAISLVPARILGVDHRVGTLEVGKDMDAIVMNGDVLHYQTFVEWAVVAGKLVYDKQEEIFFAHIRPRPKAPAPEEEEPTEAEEGESEADEEADESTEHDEDEGEHEGEGEEEEGHETGDEDEGEGEDDDHAEEDDEGDDAR